MAQGRRAAGARGASTATSYDVARRAGVSQSAVSRCFKAGASVAPATRARILHAAEALGYAPNALARSLITQTSGLVAVLIPSLTNLYYPEVLSALTARLAAHGLRVLLFTLSSEREAESLFVDVWRYRVDGVIAAANLDARVQKEFAARDVPLVLYNRHGDPGAPVSSVCCDSQSGERRLVERMAASGRRRFGVIAGPSDSFVSRERVRGATEQLAQLGLPFEVTEGGYDYASGAAGLATLMQASAGRMDALVCANDVMAIGALDAARHALGLRVPEDLAVAGFDGVGPAAWSSYDLTTMRQPVDRMAEAAVQMIVERIAEPGLTPERRLFAGELVAGRTA